MSKHVLDHPQDRKNSKRPAQFSQIEADEKPRPQTKALQKRQRVSREGARLKAFAKIDRQSDR